MRAALLFLALLFTASSAVELAERVLKTLEGRLSTELPLDTARVTLNGGAQYSAIPRQDGSFKLHAVPPGTYLLEVMDTQSVWPTVRIEVSATAPGKARAHLTHSRQPLPFPLPLEPLVAKPTFFEKREGFQWSQMLMNPMVIMMGVTVLIMVVFPKMMQNMDPEQARARTHTPCDVFAACSSLSRLPLCSDRARVNACVPSPQLEEMKQMQGGLASMLNPDAAKPKAIEKPATGAEKRKKAGGGS